MIPSSFEYHRATSVDDALAKIAAGNAKLLAGGHSLVPLMKLRLSEPGTLVDIARIPELSGIREQDGRIEIGAATVHHLVASSALLRDRCPGITDAAATIGDPQVRNRGTMGGSLANNDPSADYPAAVLGLGATVLTDSRSIAADDFFDGLFATSLEEGEIIRAISFPVPERAAYEKFAHPASRFALVGVMVSKGAAGVRVAATGAGQAGVFRVAEMESALGRDFSARAIEGVKVSADDMIADIHAPPAYRAQLVGVLARRAVAAIA